MQITTRTFLLACGILAACDATAPTARSTNQLVASDAARQLGVAAYVLAGDEAQLIGTDGATLGTLRVSAPSAEVRRVDISFADGATYEDEVTRPVAGRFDAPLPEGSREVAIQADPALASLFASHGVHFSVVSMDGNSIAPSATATCAQSDFNWAAGCNQCGQNSGAPCQIFSGTDSHGDYTQAIAYAKCTAVFCVGNPTWPLDLVSKTRTCYTVGSCSNQAGGFASCTNSSCFQP